MIRPASTWRVANDAILPLFQPSGAYERVIAKPSERIDDDRCYTHPTGPSAAQRRSRRDRRPDLRASLGDGAAASVMVGMGETYLPAFALAAGAGEVAAGLVSTLPLLAGAILQMLAPRGVRWVGSYRRWVLACATLQAGSLLPLVVAAWCHCVPTPLVFLAASLYWGMGLAANPAWNTWMGTLVPAPVRAAYFSRRTRVCQVGTLLGFVGAGAALQWGAASGAALDTFALVLLFAALARLVSVGFLAAKTEPEPPADERRATSPGALWQRARGTSQGRLLLFLLAVPGAAQISGPYFNPYMLQQLKFSYVQYVALIGAALVARIVALPWLGRLARRLGARGLLWFGGAGIVPLSAAWLVSDSFVYLVGLQLVVGVFWGAYELASQLLLIETIPESERTSVLTAFNLVHAASTVAGSLLGGAALLTLGKQPVVYLGLFVASSVARLGALGLLWSSGTGAEAAPLPADKGAFSALAERPARRRRRATTAGA